MTSDLTRWPAPQHAPASGPEGLRPGQHIRGWAGRDRPTRAATIFSLAAVGAGVAVQLLLPGGWGSAGWGVLVAGLLAGLPHGAVDHLVPAHRLGWRPVRLVLFAGGYAALAGCCYLLFLAAPGPALVGFLALSAWHFGSGETAFADLRAGRPVRNRVLPALITGALVLVPLVRDPADTGAVVAAVVPGSDGQLPGWLPATVLAVVLPAAGLLLLGLLAGCRWLEAVETATLLVLVLVVPPLAAFGIWFGCWHAVRHTSRVIADDPAFAADLRAGRPARPLRRFAAQAALPTLVVLLTVALLWSAAGGWQGFVATDLPVLAALTVPHALVVSWLDRRQAARREAPADR